MLALLFSFPSCVLYKVDKMTTPLVLWRSLREASSSAKNNKLKTRNKTVIVMMIKSNPCTYMSAKSQYQMKNFFQHLVYLFQAICTHRTPKRPKLWTCVWHRAKEQNLEPLLFRRSRFWLGHCKGLSLLTLASTFDAVYYCIRGLV